MVCITRGPAAAWPFISAALCWWGSAPSSPAQLSVPDLWMKPDAGSLWPPADREPERQGGGDGVKFNHSLKSAGKRVEASCDP